MNCSISGCCVKVIARGFCSKHYQRWKSHGDASHPTKEHRPNGAGCKRKDGYLIFQVEGQNKLGHVIVAERALGKTLPKGANVHHVDENRSNNDPANLVICKNLAYHMLLHKRQRAYDACGNANWLHCWICGKYDEPSNLYVNKTNDQSSHRSCLNAKRRADYIGA